MLINTVILFLKDLLPIFILFCLLKSNIRHFRIQKKVVLLVLTIIFIGIIATFKLLPLLSELWQGAGIEIIQTIQIGFVYVCLVFSSSYIIQKRYPTSCQLYVIVTAFVVFLVLNISTFIVFLESYLINSESAKVVFAGLAIGLGISLSFSSLLLFLLLWLTKKKYYTITYSFWAFFLTGQLSQVVNLLQQVDIIQSSEALWDSSILVEDRSEYGHILNTLVGYEASPSGEFILIYLLSLFTLFIYFYVYSDKKSYEYIDRPEEKSI